MKIRKILFVSINNSTRSQIAEAYMNLLSCGRYIAESAGLEKGELHPLAVQVMSEEGIDISQNTTNKVIDFYREGRLYHYVIRLFDDRSDERCPVFPDIYESIHWNIPNPSASAGTNEEKLANIRKVRQMIRDNVIEWVRNH